MKESSQGIGHKALKIQERGKKTGFRFPVAGRRSEKRGGKTGAKKAGNGKRVAGNRIKNICSLQVKR